MKPPSPGFVVDPVHKEVLMRNLVLAVSAAAVAVPVSMAFPTEEAQAQRRYYRDGDYRGPTWRGRDGRYRCRRSNGTTGLLVGGAAGALIGREIDGGRGPAQQPPRPPLSLNRLQAWNPGGASAMTRRPSISARGRRFGAAAGACGSRLLGRWLLRS
jgi:hypothetical protein